jgi:hypothetical protein
MTGLLAVFTLAACGGAVTTTVAAPAVPVSPAPASSAASLTAAQGTAICKDFNAWAVQAGNQDMPRFNAQLQNDETQASGTQLGTDMAAEDQGLQRMNSAALMPGPPGDPQPVDLLRQDCASYGVTLKPSG